jgi:hypothetical protein
MIITIDDDLIGWFLSCLIGFDGIFLSVGPIGFGV